MPGVNLPASQVSYYLLTLLVCGILHEIGHAIGIGHSEIEGSLMFPFYGGAHQYLHADDIAAAKAIYGEPVPEPSTLALFALGLVAAGAVKRRRRRNAA